MKKINLLAILLVVAWQAKSQQYVQYTQFMFNKIALNPAYAGSKEGPTLSGLYRTQWVKLEGAPVSQSFSFHTPILGDKLGLGISIHHDEIGPTHYLVRLGIRNFYLILALDFIIIQINFMLVYPFLVL